MELDLLSLGIGIAVAGYFIGNGLRVITLINQGITTISFVYNEIIYCR